jgi:hypothetical protein
MCMVMKYRRKYKETRNCRHRLKILIDTNKQVHTHNTHKNDSLVEVIMIRNHKDIQIT